MWTERLGQLQLSVERRRSADDGGPTLRLSETLSAGRELLRFDCFERSPHFHVDPSGRDEISALDPLADNIGWVLAELRRDLPGYLAKANSGAALPSEAEELTRVLAGAEAAMRNPPPDLDNLDLARLRTRRGEKWSHYEDDVLPAWVAEMDFPLAEPVRQVLRRATDRSDLGYPVDLEQTGLAEAFAERMAARFDWKIDPRRVLNLADVVQGVYACIDVFSEPGDGVVVQTPIYPPFLHAVRETGRRLIDSPLRQSRAGFEFDPDALREQVDSGARVLLLCNPHNPAGRVFRRDELEALAALALERDLIVVSDEIHADLVFDGHAHIPFASLGDEVAARTVTLTSATKAFNIPGLRCAVAHFGDGELQRRFESRHPSHSRGGVGLLGIYATIAAWQHAQPWLDAVLAYLAANRALLQERVAADLPGVVFHPPEATYLAWLDFRQLALPRSPAHFFLERARVALSDGHHFGANFEGFARLNFATSRSLLTQILDQLAEALRSER